jgi:sucrose 6(F)-phosphate phosphorylase
VLHALATGQPERLAAHLASSPDRQVTTLDCHDGIPVRPDLEGVLAPDEMRSLGGLALARGGNINRILSRSHASDGVDVHQLNVTYYSALASDDDRYIAARAIQLFARGIPQVYYVGLLAGENDTAAVAATGDGRSINRHNYSRDEVEHAMARPVVRRLLDLIELRNTHDAFDGTLSVTRRDATLRMSWTNGAHRATLDVDALRGTCSAGATDGGDWRRVAA